jgi:hypothetical protein
MNVAESNNPEMGFEESIERIGALLEPEKAKPAPKAKDPSDEADEAEPEEAQADSEESEFEEDEAPDESDTDEQPDEAKFEDIEIDGASYRVPPELKPYILREQDYRRKTQEVAERRKAADAEIESSRQAREQYLRGLDVVGQSISASLPPAPTEEDWDNDPIHAGKLERQRNQALQRLNAAGHEYQRVQQQIQQEQNQAWQKSLHEAAAKLPDLIPAWKDPKRAATERAALREFLAKEGYSPEEIASAADPRAIALSRKAWLYEQMIEQKKAAKPIPPKAVAPGASRPTESKNAFSKAHQALKRSGGTDKRAAEFLIGKFLKD